MNISNQVPKRGGRYGIGGWIVAGTIAVSVLVAWGCAESDPAESSTAASPVVPERALGAGASAQESDPGSGPPAPRPERTRPLRSERSERGSAIDVTGEVFQELYVSMSPNSSASPIAYHVTAKVKNNGTTALAFDTVEGRFFPKVGRPLRIVQRTVPEGMDIAQIQRDPDAAVDDELKPGDERTLNFSTNGHTMSLLRDAGNDPLRFGLIFRKKETAVTDMYVAELPDVQGLPSYDTRATEQTQGKPLAFNTTPLDRTARAGSGSRNVQGRGPGAPGGFEWVDLEAGDLSVLKPRGWRFTDRSTEKELRFSMSEGDTATDEDTPTMAVDTMPVRAYNASFNGDWSIDSFSITPTKAVDRFIEKTKENARNRASRSSILTMYRMSDGAVTAYGIRERSGAPGASSMILDHLHIPHDERQVVYLVLITARETEWDDAWEKCKLVAQQFFGSVVEH